jgi:hypothetical protein
MPREGAPECRFLSQFLNEVAAIVGFTEGKDRLSKVSTKGAARMSSNAQATGNYSMTSAANGTEQIREPQDVRLLLDAIPTPAWSARADGFADFFNQNWLNYTGLSVEQARDWGWTVALHPDDLKGLVDYWRSVLASGEPGEFEGRLRRFDGVYRWFLVRATPSLSSILDVIQLHSEMVARFLSQAPFLAIQTLRSALRTAVAGLARPRLARMYSSKFAKLAVALATSPFCLDFSRGFTAAPDRLPT